MIELEDLGDGVTHLRGTTKELVEYARDRCQKDPEDLLAQMSFAMNLYVDGQFSEAARVARRIAGSDRVDSETIDRDLAAQLVRDAMIAVIPAIEEKFALRYGQASEAVSFAVGQQQATIKQFTESECCP